MTLCERCETRGREREAVDYGDGWDLCDDCRTHYAEQAEADRFTAYHGGSSPQSITEQCAVALKQKQEGR